LKTFGDNVLKAYPEKSYLNPFPCTETLEMNIDDENNDGDEQNANYITEKCV
jgi:hypothetical protein